MSVDQIEIEKETIRLRESFLKQVLASSSGGLAILLGFYEKFLANVGGAEWFYFAVGFLLLSICLALYVQSKLSQYFYDGVDVIEGLHQLDLDVARLSSEIREGSEKDKALSLRRLDDLKKTTEVHQSKVIAFFETDRVIKLLSYLALSFFVIGVVSISVGLYLDLPHA